MGHKIKGAKEKVAQDLVGKTENAKDDTRMFKAAKVLYTNTKEFGLCMTNRNNVYHNH